MDAPTSRTVLQPVFTAALQAATCRTACGGIHALGILPDIAASVRGARGFEDTYGRA